MNIREVEAIVFAASRRMSGQEIADYLHADVDEIYKALNALAKEYEQRDSAIVLVEDEGLWKLSLKNEYLPLAEKLMPSTELARQVVETLALLAWKAPILQSEVIKIRSPTAYDHIAELERIGLITRAKQGRSFVIKLTEKFYEYFDVPKEKAKEMFTAPPDEPVIETQTALVPEPTFEELLQQVKDNKINPDEIIAQDKQFLDTFEKRLQNIRKESTDADETLKKMDADTDAQEIIEKRGNNEGSD